MKATKFWITAVSTVATAGMIGVAIAQTQAPLRNPDPSSTSGPVTPGGTNTGTGSSGTGSTSPDKPLTTGGNMDSSSGNTSSSSEAPTSTVAKADRG